jgi:hypothetical protein
MARLPAGLCTKLSPTRAGGMEDHHPPQRHHVGRSLSADRCFSADRVVSMVLTQVCQTDHGRSG